MATLGEQRLLLSKRAKELSTLLTELGWKVLHPEGGLFLIARPIEWEAKGVTLSNGESLTLTAENIAQAILKEKTLINDSQWTGIDGYCRFVLSVSQEEFGGEGLKRLKDFFTYLKEQ